MILRIEDGCMYVVSMLGISTRLSNRLQGLGYLLRVVTIA